MNMNSKEKRIERPTECSAPPEEPETLYLVVQNGGSSYEWYSNVYDSRELAWDHIVDCHIHTYNCVGPFKFPNPYNDELLGEIMDALNSVFRAVAQEDFAVVTDEDVTEYEGENVEF
jgi:hypothetical protein